MLARLTLLGSFIYYLCRASDLVLHEQFDHVGLVDEEDPNWRRADPDLTLPIHLALKDNSNAIQNAERWLMEVSNPDSPQYGQHWTEVEVVRAFQPTDEAMQSVRTWLESHGVEEIDVSDNQAWLAFDISASAAEQLLHTKFYEHDVKSATGEFLRTDVLCSEYYLPADISAYVDFVLPDPNADSGSEEEKLVSRNEPQRIGQRYKSIEFDDTDMVGEDNGANLGNLDHCASIVTPACVRALYGIPAPDLNQTISPNNTMGMAEFQNDIYYQPDLDLYLKRYTEIPEGTSPFFKAIDGAHGSPPTPGTISFNYSAESDLDIETALSLIYPQNVTVFQTSNKPNNGWFGRFIAAIDASFCLANRRNHGSHRRQRACGVYKSTNVMSISWGDSELAIPQFWELRQCAAYLKLGLQGVTVVTASGDNGVGIRVKTDTTKRICPGNGKFSTGQFSPNFPAACPWVTTVGGTEIPDGGNVSTTEHSASWYYHNRTANTTSYDGSGGGGFAIRFPRPHYQESQVSHFFQTANPRWKYYTDGHYQNSTGRYNRNGRGYPDIAAVGKHMPLCYGDKVCVPREGGTSFSTPVVGAILNHIIEERIRVGKGPLGFVNPVLYQHPEAFTDIVKGGNGNCSPDDGFECAPGWDPVTGLGTPHYSKLLDIFLNLP